jgi:triacylglycerol esterase/lipase EstA (alpha/beta hydrolase family)
VSGTRRSYTLQEVTTVGSNKGGSVVLVAAGALTLAGAGYYLMQAPKQSDKQAVAFATRTDANLG